MQNARINDILSGLRATLPQRNIPLPNDDYPYVVDVEIARADLDDAEYIHVVGVLEREASDLVADDVGAWAVKRQPELTPCRHEELTPSLVDVVM